MDGFVRHKVIVEHRYSYWARRLWIIGEREGGPAALMVAPSYRDIEEGDVLPEETLCLSHDALDRFLGAFAEAAWELGWRPQGFTKIDLTATERHLEDMRSLVASAYSVRWK